MTPTLTFVCSICGEPSVSICVHCTKDACPNHICERCGRCSDCCECDVRLDEPHEQIATPEIAAPVVDEPAPEAPPLPEMQDATPSEEDHPSEP